MMSRIKYDIKQLFAIPPPYGGVSVHVKRLVDNLTKDGYIVGAYYDRSNKNPQLLNSELYDLLWWNSSASKVKKIWNHVIRIIRFLYQVKSYRIVHSHSSLENMFLIWVMKHMMGKKIVITVHNSMQREFFENTSSFNRVFMKFVAKSDVQWVAVSEQAKEGMLDLPLNFVNTIHVIPAYIPEIPDLSKPLPPKMQTYIKSHKKIISFYGHSFMIHNGKDVYGFETALDLYERILKSGQDDVGLVMCVQEIEDVEELIRLHDKAKSRDINDKIYWHEGGLDNIICLWNKSDVYIRPTSTDGDSVAVREAIDIGVKVVASDVCVRPEGVAIYKFGKLDDFYEKTMNELGKPKSIPNQNFDYYYRIRAIYDILLKN